MGMEPETLISTPIGSRLYGLAHADSDYDLYQVFADTSGGLKKHHNARQTIVGKNDVIRISWSTFLNHASQGYPQALEAMFSPLAEVSPQIMAYRAHFHASLTLMTRTYHKTIISFAHGPLKQRIYALRLSHNLRQSQENGGRFNPVLEPHIAEAIKAEACVESSFYERLAAINYYEILSFLNEEEIHAQFIGEVNQ